MFIVIRETSQWGAGIGSGGKTSDPARQEEYNKCIRTQITELLTLYGDMTEVWFDGSCIINVNDILQKYAPMLLYCRDQGEHPLAGN